MSDLDPDAPLARTAASSAVEAIGWRYLLGTLCTSVPVTSLEQALQLSAAAASACTAAADAHLRIDVRPDRVELSLQTRATGALTGRDVELARAVTAAVAELGGTTGGATSAESARPVQMLEVAIDAIDIGAIRPFWKAVLAYGDEPSGPGGDAIIDPTGQLPCIWFQQMDEPRPQRNRIHFDITVSHDEAEARVKAALDAGGVLVSDSAARSFWILADVEGNEVCVCTWLDRDERDAARAAESS
ncbi:MAG: 4a-hydroxytetrahydrobiopterin dehydratase [Pseudonocardiales bacterium]|nr:MAG: 4a-hydroxytetrahydrobiopterin dehydratase [Pseudonocardiales bacterium]